jgi:hypothetical protein
MTWRLAQSLEKLRQQLNATYPNRGKASDGTVGDQAHQAEGSGSDHNPNKNGVVCALDITHDPSSGCNVQVIADNIIASQDSRVKYLIFNDHICVPSDYGWKWVFHYKGSHRNHLHVSVWGNYDDEREWNIGKKESSNMITTRDQAFEVYRSVLKRDPANEKEVNDVMNRDVFEVLTYLRTTKAGEFVQAQVVNFPQLQKIVSDLQTSLTNKQSTAAEKKLEEVKSKVNELEQIVK